MGYFAACFSCIGGGEKLIYIHLGKYYKSHTSTITVPISVFSNSFPSLSIGALVIKNQELFIIVGKGACMFIKMERVSPASSWR